MVSRRDVLRACGVGLTVSAAGCTGNGDGDGGGETGDGGSGGNGGGDDGGGGNGGGSDGSGGDGGGGDGDGSDGGGSDGGGGDGMPGSDVDVGMIYAVGGLGDQSFSDAANRGIRRASEDLGVSFQNAEPQNSQEVGSFQDRFARSTDPDYDLVVCLGFEQVDSLQDNAPSYADQNWALLDATLDESNVESWVYAEEQGSYLVGRAAAMLSGMDFSAGGASTDPGNTTLGFVGGVEVPVVQAFEAGFRAGAKSVNEDFEVLSSYVGGFSNPGDAEETAQSMIDEGADVLYHGAGAGGVGVFRACQSAGRFVFGADSQQSVTAPDFSDVILGSMIKGVDTSVYRAVERVVNGEFAGGETFELGADEGGFELVWGEELGDAVPQSVKDDVASTRTEIANGNIDVPVSPQ